MCFNLCSCTYAIYCQNKFEPKRICIPMIHVASQNFSLGQESPCQLLQASMISWRIDNSISVSMQAIIANHSSKWLELP
jgi:hypothetical protein